jgi:hypothetical protein
MKEVSNYISEGTWFVSGSECILLEDYRDEKTGYNSGLFEGTYRVGSCNSEGYDKHWYNKGYKDGDLVLMSEVCNFDEFTLHSKSE